MPLAILGGKPVIKPEQLKAKWPLIDEEDIEAVAETMRSGIIWGADSPNVESLEREWAKYTGTKFCLAMNSGTSALHSALRGVGVKAGDEVIVPAFTFHSSGAAVIHQNAIPVFTDMCPDTFTIDPLKIEERINKKTKAILAVHLFGLPADMDEINEIGKDYNIKVIEDGCQAHGATYKGKMTGNLADAGTFSLNGSKNLMAGEGGLFNTNDKDIYENALMLRMSVSISGKRDKYPVYSMGYNYRLPEIPAALARSQLKKLEVFNSSRQINSELLNNIFYEFPQIVPPFTPYDRSHVYHMYRLRFDFNKLGVTKDFRRHRIMLENALNAEGVRCGQWMDRLVPERRLFQLKEGYGHGCPWTCRYGRDIKYDPAEYPVAREFLDTTTQLYDVPTMKSPDFAGLYKRAFQKVFDNLDAVFSQEI